MRLLCDMTAPSQSRLIAQLWAAQHRVPAGAMDDLLLTVSELVTCAVYHGQPPIELELTTDYTRVRGVVRDGSGVHPAGIWDDSEDSGYSFLVVEACTSRWGAEQCEDGKVVWFEIDYVDSHHRWGAHATYN